MTPEKVVPDGLKSYVSSMGSKSQSSTQRFLTTHAEV
jgi:hypothetical protein